MVEVDRVVDASGPQGVALQVQRLGGKEVIGRTAPSRPDQRSHAILPVMPSDGFWDRINRYVSPPAAVITVLNTAATFATWSLGLLPDINAGWALSIYFIIVIPFAVAVSPPVHWFYCCIAEWWTREARIFESLAGIMGRIRAIETGNVPDYYPSFLNDSSIQEELTRLHNDLHERLSALGIRPDVERAKLYTQVLYGTLRRARKL